ncbi:MAG: DUF3604 domain-containing protein [Myxococcota bacterium]
MEAVVRRLVSTPFARLLALALLVAACSEVKDPSLDPVGDPRFDEPAPPLRALGRDEHRNVFWGDLHIHTSYSYDAYTFGVVALPDDAYTFAKGGTIQHGIGYPIRASRPLDFAAVTDHAEYLGVARHRGRGGPDPGASLRAVLETGSRLRITWEFIDRALFQMGSLETRDEVFGGEDAEVSRRAWRDIVAAAERHNEPGRFTTFVAYEWSSMPDERNLHRNVVYRGSRAPDLPFSSLDSDDPEDLWRALEAQRADGIEVIAIPHNGNVSGGLMYDRVTLDGAPLTAEYAETRMRNEPISEILQVKGSSETHPLLSSEDEFAGFELYDRLLSASGAMSEPRGSYARYALRTGLELSAREGFNPYRFGVIGSSDSHNASSPVEEDDYHGKLPLLDGTVAIRLGESLLIPESQHRGLRWSAQGLAAVWAEENTRESLFDALRRKETYATSGPRIRVRFFGGWSFEPGLVDAPDFAARAYAEGVPMGGTLHRDAGVAGAPRFAVVALKDPRGAHLDRVQIVKGWVDEEGASHERIYDVAASGGRLPDARHRVGPVGSSVDVARATYRNNIGAPQLSAVWSDPDFDATVESFYYARVIEIPTPRWSTYDARAMGVPAPEPATLQERAITSAIWYRPEPATR